MLAQICMQKILKFFAYEKQCFFNEEVLICPRNKFPRNFLSRYQAIEIAQACLK